MRYKMIMVLMIAITAISACTTKVADAQRSSNMTKPTPAGSEIKIFLNGNEIGPLTATDVLERELVRIGTSRNDEGLYRKAPKVEDEDGLIYPPELDLDVWLFPDDKVSAIEFARIYSLVDDNVSNVYLRRNSGIDLNKKIGPQPLFLAITLGSKVSSEPLNLPSYDEKREYSTIFQTYIEDDPLMIHIMQLATNAIEVDKSGDLWIYEAYPRDMISDDWEKTPVKRKKIEWAKLGDEILQLMSKNPAELKERLQIIVEKDVDYGQIRRVIAAAEEKAKKIYVELHVINK